MNEKNIKLGISREKFPALYLASSQASQEAQSTYLKLTKLNLGLLVVGAISSSVFITTDPNNPNLLLLQIRLLLSYVSALSLFVSLIVTVILLLKKFEKTWYAGRAISESVKTVVWRYMMRAEPYGTSLSLSEADALLQKELKLILEERKYLSGDIGGDYAQGAQITEEMRKARTSSVSVRKQMYIEDRVENQKKWYNSKSKINKAAENTSYAVIGLSQLLALFSAVVVIFYSNSWINPTGIFAAISAAFIAWTQLKQSHVLSQSYGMATHELGLIATRSSSIQSNSALSDFVIDAENAISREHTMWRAKREQTD